ncbi:MAG: TonB-dependent siderophore receptor [Candidatus Devosia phytovorans]|uniref:TonB-dependent siderophore receptor n=1 Tax=Candidatus Devosia phytovorans TaxID=3121372 RepID=A0AAJ5VQX4_9HYPH|nr:TonB-dependent siderophore receptor [Devosia sp.]WEK02984.1 MAG: TonB-dependent siderophore receptor [Devosia sp.]
MTLLEQLVIDGIEAEGPGEGIIANQSRTATKTATPVALTPQSISVVTRQQMDRQNVETVNQALRYTPGVAAELWGGVTGIDQLSIRGFNNASTGLSDTFLDGLRLRGGVFFATQQVDPFLLERVEVLKGPSSVLYGNANPGGIVALSSKLPTGEALRLVELAGGTGNHGRVSVDLGGSAADQTLLYRLAATLHTTAGQGQGTTADRFAIAPSVTWQPSAETSLTLMARVQHDPRSGTFSSLPAFGTLFPNPNGWLPIDAYVGEPGYNRTARDQVTFGYQFDHAFNQDWSVSSRARYGRVDMDIARVVLSGLQADMRTVDRAAEVSSDRFDTFDMDHSISGHLNTGPIEHDVLVGAGYEYFSGRGDYGQGYAPPLDIFAPTYGAPIVDLPMIFMDNSVISKQFGLYVQDQMTLGNWHATLVVRHDWSSIETVDHLMGGGFTQNDEATTFRGGLLYRFDNGIAPYFNYAQSFQPLNQLSASGLPFEPTRGELYEVGIKYQPDGWNGLLSASLFHLTQANTLTTDPANPAFSIQAGEIASMGFELEARASLTDQFEVIAGYTYQDVSYSRDNSGWVGKTPLRTPEHIASAWLTWTAPDGPLAGIEAGVGVRYSGGTLGGTMDDQFETGSYALVDASLNYDFGDTNPNLEGLNLQLNAHNLFDNRHVAACYDATTGCFYGSGRSLTAKVSNKF